MAEKQRQVKQKEANVLKEKEKLTDTIVVDGLWQSVQQVERGQPYLI